MASNMSKPNIYTLAWNSGQGTGPQGKGTSTNCMALRTCAAYVDQGLSCEKLFDMACSYKSSRSICELQKLGENNCDKIE